MKDAEFWMEQAIQQARIAASLGEVPVGAVIVCGGEVIAKGYNQCEKRKDPTCHAELMAIRAATERLGRWRLQDCEIYVTLEPCLMCIGGILNARIPRLYFGAFEPQTGACGSTVNPVFDSEAYRYLDIFPGVLETQCRALMQDFFRSRRATC